MDAVPHPGAVSCNPSCEPCPNIRQIAQRLGVAELSPPFMRCSTCCNTGQESLLMTSQHLGDSLQVTWTVAWQQRPLLRSHCRQRFALKGCSFVPNKIHRAEGCTVSDCSKAPGLHHSYHRPITTVAQDLHIIRLGQDPKDMPARGRLHALHTVPRSLSKSLRSFCLPLPGTLHATEG